MSPEPAPTDYGTQEVNQFLWDANVTFPFIFALRAELEARAGGNLSWNTGVNYFTDLARSADLREVTALYKAAGLSLTRTCCTLNNAPRISAKPSAVTYLAKYICFNGDISVPVLSMHTTGDGLVVPQNEQAYRASSTATGTATCCGRSSWPAPGTARSPRPRPSPRLRRC